MRLCVSAWLMALLMAGPDTPGAISVASEPTGAAVYVDGQFVGHTPLDVKSLLPGDHRVRVVKDGFLENGRIVSVAAGRTGSLQVRLTARTATDALPEGQTSGGGISSGGGGGLSKKTWLWIGAAGGGAAATAWLLSNRASISLITASPATALQSGTVVTFSATGPSAGDELSWDFGDGTTSNEFQPRHVFTTAGTFTVKCSIGGSDRSATTPVTVRNLTGTWRGTLNGVLETLVITQSSATLSGNFSDEFGGGPLIGFVATASPFVRITLMEVGFFPFTYTSDPNAAISTLTGSVNGSGYNNASLVLTRQ